MEKKTVLIIEDNVGYSTNAGNELTALGHIVISCNSVAEWRRRIRVGTRRKETMYYNNYDFSDMELYPYIDEGEVDVVLTDLFMPTDGTTLGYKLGGREPELPYGYVIALRYLALGKQVAIVTNGELCMNMKGEYVKSTDHHSTPLMSVNDLLMHLPNSNFVYQGYKNYMDAFDKLNPKIPAS